MTINSESSNLPLISILGPTASGKTSLAIALAEDIDGEIISADSRQVYRLMDIGTGKDVSDYEETPYHLIDIIDAGEKYNVAMFQQDFEKAFEEIRKKGRYPILCGGSGLYLQAVLQVFKNTKIPINLELRKELEQLTMETLRRRFYRLSAQHSYPTNPSSKRQLIRAVEILSWQESSSSAVIHAHKKDGGCGNLIFGLNPNPLVRRDRISRRLKKRIDEGMIDEVKYLLDSGISPEDLIYYGLEYKWTTLYLQGELDYASYFKKLETAIHQFAKRQMTYFRKMEKDGLKIHWLPFDAPIESHIAFIKSQL